MKILCIRSDKPEAEIYLYDNQVLLGKIIWQAHRELGNTIHNKIKKLLDEHKISFKELDAIACYQGPGSFTGLRIGLTVANTLASELDIAIVGASGDDWQNQAIEKLQSGENQKIVLPEYGCEPHITTQKR